jgi:hypothetical protein
MKRLNGKRGLLRAAALGQVLLLVVAGCKSPGEKGVSEEAVRQALVGKDGDRTVNVANTIVNGYSALTATGTNTVTVNAIADFATGGRPALAVGDLVLIIQMQGATIGTLNDATYGNVSDYNAAGNYEFAGVAAIAGNVITLGCALKNAYTVAGNAQVIRVPQYDTLTITSAGSITAPAWNGTVGGVVAVQAATTLQLNGSIDVTGTGFRGGTVDVTKQSQAQGLGVALYRSAIALDGAVKGESIAGLAANLGTTGRYGRGAPANGGGGGNSHNAGGGGGANAAASGTWTGEGVMLSTVLGGAAAWLLETGGGSANSSGGGRGGYTFSGNAHNATILGPNPPFPTTNPASWGGNNRQEHGGLGGHPLTASAGGKLFLGGGGGAGDGNDGHAGPGGPGGGLVFVIAGTVQGAGSIVANGAPGGAVNTGNGISSDAAGGGGGGGTVVVHAAALSQISVAANGGLGGNQTVNNQNEAEGPGGGGGGGYVALSGGTPASVSASGRLGGTTNSPGVAQFPSNGATAGHEGVTDGDAATILYCTAANTTLDTTIASAPATLTNVAAATFTFTSVPATGVTFQCILDGNETGSWTTTPCSSPYTTAALAGGTHVIYVRAKDAVGNVDTTPASYTWTVDLTPPDTTIGTKPDNPSTSPTGNFTFSGTDADAGGDGVTFECRMDTTTTWTACSSPYTTPALTYGSHTLYVRAVDLAGNVDPTPATYTWEAHLLGLDGSVVDTAVPDSAVIDTAVIDTAVIDTAVILADSAVPDTRPDSAVSDLPIVVSPDVRLDSPVADRAPDLVPDAPAVGIPDAGADGGLGDALADVGARDAVAKDTQVFPVVDSSPIDTTAPNPVPDAQIVVDTAVPVPPVPDAAVGPGPQEPTAVLNNPKVMGSGFCSVNSMPNSAPGLFTFFLVAAFGLLVSRRRRR